MQEWTEKLLKLQELDLSIAKLTENLAQIPAKIQDAEKLFVSEAAAFKLARQQQLMAEQQCAKLEADAVANAGKKREFQQKTSLIKKNDEYKAALEQLAQFDVNQRKIEEEQLEWMEKVEAAKADVQARERTFNLARKRAASVKDDLMALDGNCRRQLAEYQQQRPQYLQEVDEQLLRRYEQLRANRNFSRVQPCVVPVISESCGRCRMRVTPQLCQKAEKGGIVFCEQCGAILYVD
jgi:predicted  nucleic acid-binding Zn-ribbon protein